MMRYERKVLSLSIALGVLLAAWALGSIFSPERSAARSESSALASGKTADVASIELTSPGAAPIALSKSGGSWVLVEGSAKLPVQSSRVDNLLDALYKPSRLRAAARSKSAWSDFQLDEAKAKRIVAKDAAGKTLADVSVGGYGPTGSEVYLRRGGSELSYAADAAISAYAGYSRSAWLDLKVLGSAAAADVQSVSVRSSIALDGKGKSALSLDWSARREGQLWKLGSAEADAQAIESLIRSALAVQGEDIASSPPAGAFSPVAARVELSLSSGVSKVLEIGAPAEGSRFYLRATGNPLVYLVSDYSLRAMLKSPAELAKKK
jgi:hypothetical protein